MEKTHLDKYGIDVKRYISYAEIQAILTAMGKCDGWVEREQNKDLLLLHFVCGLPIEEIEEHGHDYYLQSGMINAVKANVSNIFDLDDAIAYENSPVRLLRMIAREMPEFSKQVDEVLKNAPSKKQ